MKLLIFLTFTTFVAYSKSFTLDCNFQSTLFKQGLPFATYNCEAEDPIRITSWDRDVTAINGGHLDGRNNDDVTCVNIGRKSEYFPRKITKFFKNVEEVIINKAGLKEIGKEDLEQFGDKLKELYIDNNDVETITFDLFAYNPNLDTFSANNNKLLIVQSGAFSSLSQLQSLKLRSNPCTNESVGWSREEVLAAIKRVKESCK